MGTRPRLSSITSARLAVIPADRRDSAIATLATALSGRARLRAVSPSDSLTGQVGSLDLGLGLYARLSGRDREELVGFVAVREQVAEEIGTPSGILRRPERLFVIEMLTLAAGMQPWRPPLRSLLAASAAMLIATMAHDPNYLTYVACRTPATDILASEALRAIGGQVVSPLAGGSPVVDLAQEQHALHFLDHAAAARSALIVLEHMADVDPAYDLPSSGTTLDSEAVLMIAYPWALRALTEELVELRDGRIALDWQAPVVIGNDLWVPRSRPAHAARF